MAEWRTLLLLEIEDPQTPKVYANAYGFTDLAEGCYVPSGSAEPARFFAPALLEAGLPARVGDLYGQADSGEGSAQVSVSLSEFPALKLLHSAVRFQRGRGRIYWWTPGLTLKQATLIWKGQIRDPVIDVDAGSFSCSLGAWTHEVDAPFPPSRAGDVGRFGAIPDSSMDQPLPVLYGFVKGLEARRISIDPGPSPPAAASSTVLALAGHRLPTQSVALVFRDDGATYGNFTVQTGKDGLGDDFAYIAVANTVTGPGGEPWEQDGIVWVRQVLGWSDGSAPIYRLGDVLVHLLRNYAREQSVELDWQRIGYATPLLNRFAVACVFNSPSSGSLLRVLLARFGAEFPVVFGWARGVFGWDFVGRQPDYHGSMGAVIWRHNAHERGPIIPVSADLLRSSFEVGYGVDLAAGGNAKVHRLGPENSAACAGALHRWGISEALRVDAPDAWDEPSAALLAADLAWRLTKRRVRCSYVVEEPAWIGLPLFARLLVTDPDAGWSEEPMLIESLAPISPGRVALALITEKGI